MQNDPPELDCRLRQSEATLETLAAILEGGGYSPSCSSEADIQAEAIERIGLAGLNAQAEDVSGKNRFDIRVGGHVVVEVKVDGSTDSVRRQLERYVSDPSVDCVLLLTTKQKHRSIGGLQFAKKVAVAYAIRF